jgi:hypothetical protein
MITAKKKAEKFRNNLSSLKNPRAARQKGICCSCALNKPTMAKIIPFEAVRPTRDKVC